MTQVPEGPSDTAGWVVKHAPFIWRVLLHLGVPRDRVEDASQEVLLVAIDRAPHFSGRSALSTWLYGICRNIAHDERRRFARVQRSQEPLPESVVQPAQEGQIWVKRAHEQLVNALSQLDEQQQQVFILFEIEELPMQEIAEVTGSPLSTCYSRLYAARKSVHAALRHELQDEAVSEEQEAKP